MCIWAPLEELIGIRKQSWYKFDFLLINFHIRQIDFLEIA